MQYAKRTKGGASNSKAEASDTEPCVEKKTVGYEIFHHKPVKFIQYSHLYAATSCGDLNIGQRRSNESNINPQFMTDIGIS